MILQCVAISPCAPCVPHDACVLLRPRRLSSLMRFSTPSAAPRVICIRDSADTTAEQMPHQKSTKSNLLVIYLYVLSCFVYLLRVKCAVENMVARYLELCDRDSHAVQLVLKPAPIVHAIQGPIFRSAGKSAEQHVSGGIRGDLNGLWAPAD